MKNITQYLQLFLFPILVALYAISLKFSSQGLQDIAAPLMALVAIFGALISYLLSLTIKPKQLLEKWYVNILLGFLGITLVYIALLVYSHLSF